MNLIIAFYSRIATGRNIILATLALFLVYLCLNFATIQGMSSAGIINFHGGLDSRFSYSPAEAFATLNSFQPAGRAVLSHITYPIDFVLPPVYAFFFSLVLFALLSRITSAKAVLAAMIILPFLGALSDLTENIFVLLMIGNFSETMVLHLAPAANVFTNFKWFVLVFDLLVVLFASVYLLIHKKRPPDLIGGPKI
jgi:hypothetical protein